MRQNRSRRARLERAFTLAEILTVMVIFGLLLTTVVAVMPAVLRAPAQMQAQVDEVNAAALALYKVQRDARQSDVGGVFDCSTLPVVLCSQQVGQNPVNTQAIVIAGNDGSSQFFQGGNGKNKGQALWKGYFVYWLAPSATGVGTDLMRAYVTFPIVVDPLGIPTFKSTDAVSVVTQALLLASPTVAAGDVRQLMSSVSLANGIILLRMMAGVNRGDQTALTLYGNTYARN